MQVANSHILVGAAPQLDFAHKFKAICFLRSCKIAGHFMVKRDAGHLVRNGTVPPEAERLTGLKVILYLELVLLFICIFCFAKL